MTEPIRLERAADGVATLTLCRAEEKNLVTREFVAALQAHSESLRTDVGVRCVLVCAEGPMFCAGADVKAMSAHTANLPGYIDSLITPAHEAMAAFGALPMPVVACLQGTAAGGGTSIALACDIVVAARSAKLAFAYPQLATTCDCGLSHALTQRLGPAKALHAYLSRDRWTAEEALAAGLVDQVVEDADAFAVATQLARRIASLAPGATRGAKRLFRAASAGDLQATLAAERDSFLQCAATAAFRERVAAFGVPRHA